MSKANTKKVKKEECMVCGKKVFNLKAHLTTCNIKEKDKKTSKKSNKTTVKKKTTKKTKTKELAKTHQKKPSTNPTQGAAKEVEYELFLEWSVLPTWQRGEIKLQRDFARRYKVDEATLSRWKNKEDFKKRFLEKVKSHFTYQVPDVVGSVFQESIRGNMKAAELYLQYVGELNKAFAQINQFNSFNGNPIDNIPIPQDVQEKINELRQRWGRDVVDVEEI